MTDYLSPVLTGLDQNEIENMPPAWAACRQCPASIWQLSGPLEANSKGLQHRTLTCYCRALHVVIWSPTEQSAPARCDAQIEALAQLQLGRKGVQ